MIIVPTYTANVTNNAPAGFVACAQRVFNTLQSICANQVTITLTIDYGATAGGLAAQSTNDFATFTYAQLRTALISRARTSNAMAAAGSLPVSDPTGGFTLGAPKPHALALGLAADSGNTACTFSSAITWTTDNSGGVPGGAADLEGVMFHEFTEPMGRVRIGGVAASQAEVLDLFSFTSSGVRNFNSRGGYFSIDNGTTNLSTPNAFASSGDPGDWNGGATDACNSSLSTGVVLPLSTYDRIIMDILGWQTTLNPTNASVSARGLRQRF